MDKRSPGGQVMLLWKANEAGRIEHTDATVGNNSRARSLDVQSTDAPFHGMQGPSPQKVPALPLEIIDMIPKEACKWRLSRAEHKVLIACTLVCKSWLSLALRLLYESVIVQTGRAYARRSQSRHIWIKSTSPAIPCSGVHQVAFHFRPWKIHGDDHAALFRGPHSKGASETRPDSRLLCST